MLDPKIVDSITKQIYRKFPEVAGNRPKVRAQVPPKTVDESAPSTYLLTYKNSVEIPGGHIIPRLVRVVVNLQGKILKITTSR